MKLKTETIWHFDYSELLKLLREKFSDQELTTFARDHVEVEGSYKTINLYYYGPSSRECALDQEEAIRAETVFEQSKLDETERKNMQILHFIWEILLPAIQLGVIDIERVMFKR